MNENIGNRFFELVNGKIILGSCEVIKGVNGPEILIKIPYTVMNGKMIPYLSNILGDSPGAIQIHPMNILWQVPLDEFKELDSHYREITSGIVIAQPGQKIVL